MRITISSLKEKELDEFYQLFRKVLKRDFPEYSREVREIHLDRDSSKREFYKMIGKKDEVVLIAKIKGEVIGFAALEKDQGGVTNIDWFGVKRGYRNMGVGTKMMEAAEVWAREHKCHCLMLVTENKRNVAFYLKRGYDYVGMRKEAWYGVNEYLMQKNISKPFRSIFRI